MQLLIEIMERNVEWIKTTMVFKRLKDMVYGYQMGKSEDC